MSALLPTALLAAQACTGPFCGPDATFEHPADGLVGAAAAPVICLGSGGNVLVAWEIRANGGLADIVFNRRTPGPGGGWLPEPRRLDTGDWGAARSLEPRIAADREGGAWVVWQDDRGGVDDLSLASSADDGERWTRDARVGGGVAGAMRSLPSVSYEAGALTVAWEDLRSGSRDLWMTRSTDRGVSWEPERRIDSDEAGAGVSYHPQILSWEDGTLLVAWWDERDGLGDVYVRRTAPEGGAWQGAEKRLCPGEPGEGASQGVTLMRDGDTVSLAWEETSGPRTGQVLSRTSTDRGATWNESLAVGMGERPFVVARSGLAPIVGWANTIRGGSGLKTSIGGRIREIPIPVASNVSVPGGRVTPLVALEGLAAQWVGRGGQNAYVARGGTAAGRGVVDVNWLDLTAPDILPQQAARLNYGQALLRTPDDVTAHSVTGAVTPAGELHLVWVNQWAQQGVLAYRAIVTGS